MEAWREKALELFPGDREGILEQENLAQLWFSLWPPFEAAHKEPADLDRIRATYQFARWAVEVGDHGPGGQATDDDWATITLAAFYEDLPVTPKARLRMHEFLDREEIFGFSEIFKYHLNPEEHHEFMKEVLAVRQRFERDSAKREREIQKAAKEQQREEKAGRKGA